MRIREINLDADYPMLADWWAKRGLPPAPKLILAGADGFLAEFDGKPIVAGWIYISNKGLVGMVEWVTSNPGCRNLALISDGITRLYDFIEGFAKDLGCAAVFTTTPVGHSLKKVLERRDWLACEGEPHQHLIKAL